MSDQSSSQPAGWYYAQGDPPGTQRYWDGSAWQGGPQAMPTAEGFGGPGGYTKDTLPSPWVRLLARIIDSLIVAIPALIVGLIIGGTAGVGGGGFSSNAFTTDGATLAASLAAGLIALGYEYYFLAKDGATPGKKVMNIKVISEDGSELGSDGALRRLILAAAGYIPFVGGLIGLVVGLGTVIMIFTDDRRQVPADKVAKSLVIKA